YRLRDRRSVHRYPDRGGHLTRWPQPLAGRRTADGRLRGHSAGGVLSLVGGVRSLGADHLAPDGLSLDQIDFDAHTKTPAGRHRNRSSALHGKGWLDDVLG